MSWETVFYVEYGGPIVIILLLLALSEPIYGRPASELSFKQKIGTAMALFHYVKRELETIFVHRFSLDTMPLINLFKNCTGYWLVFGVLTMGFFLRPKEEEQGYSIADKVFVALFVLFELLNLKCHLILKDLRKPGTTERGIPCGFGFNQVSCANYLWELCSWIAFACFCRTNFGAWLFVVLSLSTMGPWAIKKHKRYRKEFPDYPRNRKAMIPFIF